MTTEQKAVQEFNKMDLNQFAAAVHKANEKWWQDPRTQKPIERNKKELLMLAISELGEAVNGERKDAMDDKLPHRKMAEVEMADTYIRLCDFAAGFGYPLVELKPTGDPIPSNKAEYLFDLSSAITSIPKLPIKHGGVLISGALAGIRRYCETHGYDLDGAIKEKMAFNAVREDHKHEARIIAGGKQF